MFSAGEFQSQYRDKLTSADDAVAPVADGSLFTYGALLAEPPAVLWAFANRMRFGDLKRLRVFSGPPTATSMDSILALDLADGVERVSQFVGAADRGLVRAGLTYYLPNHFYQLPRLVAEHMQIDVCATTVSPMDRSGFFSFGTNNDFISTAARCAKRVIVEVNEFMPRVHGDSRIHVSEVSAVVENHTPLAEVALWVPGPEDEPLARLIADMIPDGATIQLGVGALPSAVCTFLGDRKDLGIHTEYMCQGLVDLVKAGAATGAKKTLHRGKHVFTIASGGPEMLDFLHDNPAFESYPVSHTNHPTVIAQNDHMVSVNAVIEVDLLGQCNAEVL